MSFGNILYYFFYIPLWLAWKLLVGLWYALDALFLVISDYWSRYWNRAFLVENKQRSDEYVRKQFAAIGCALCRKPLQPSPWIDHGGTGLAYCSPTCLVTAMKKNKAQLEEIKTTAIPTQLSEADNALLPGKSSGGMYFELGRCVKCGQALADSTQVFGFCSEACEIRAYTPYLSYRASLESDKDYKNYEQLLDDLSQFSEGDIRDESQESGTPSATKKELQEQFETSKWLAEKRHTYKTEEAFIKARVDFLRVWEKQREYIVNRERPKEEERKRKEAEKNAADIAKKLAALAEEERWKPKPFDL